LNTNGIYAVVPTLKVCAGIKVKSVGVVQARTLSLHSWTFEVHATGAVIDSTKCWDSTGLVVWKYKFMPLEVIEFKSHVVLTILNWKPS
jgi:hypothetical protein